MTIKHNQQIQHNRKDHINIQNPSVLT